MAPIQSYPVADFGPAMKGMVIGAVGIFHVFVAQFAIGGGFLMFAFERTAQRSTDPALRDGARAFVAGYFRWLVLISFVVGALTGVGMWLTTIQVSPRTIGLMVDEFHWVWATEWAFFFLEVVAGYSFLRWGPILDGRSRLILIGLFSCAAWASLFWINGILSWQLTPGDWLTGGGVWAGFFNASFWPSLLFRTVVALTLASLVAILVINALDLDREGKRVLIHRAARFMAPMAAMPALALWYFAVLPEDSRAWLLGGSVAMTMFVTIAAGASLLIGGYAAVGLIMRRLYINAATAALLLALAFGATAAGEFVREGARKPYTVRGALYSFALTPAEVTRMRAEGVLAHDPWPLADEARYPTPQLRHGARVYRALCSVCHTLHGANALTDLAGTWTEDQMRDNIAKLQRTKGFMPPFAGTADDVEAVVQLIRWEIAGTPKTWAETTTPPAVHAALAEVGTITAAEARAIEARAAGARP
jgi:cytochrome d ubiquinol oxidase subunit I